MPTLNAIELISFVMIFGGGITGVAMKSVRAEIAMKDDKKFADLQIGIFDVILLTCLHYYTTEPHRCYYGNDSST